MPSLGEQLLQAFQQRVTGKLCIFAHGRETDLFLNHGELVGARIRTDYQNPAQALLARGTISMRQLDAWWARGVANAPDDEALQGVSSNIDIEVTHIASNVRALSAIAEEMRFESQPDSEGGRRIPMAPILRAAFEYEARPKDRVYRLINIDLARPWLTPGEEEWLLTFSNFARATAETSGLLGLLERIGAVESKSASDGQRTQADLLRAMDEALRRAGTHGEVDWIGTGEVGVSEVTETIELTSDMAKVAEEVTEPGLDETGRTESPILTVPAEPVVFGPGATGSARMDDDLWKLVEFDSAPSDAASSSFEQAMERIDASLEEIIGSLPSSDAVPVEAEVEAVEPRAEDVAVDDFFHNDVWPFDEDELATDPMDPADEARARRQRLLRRAMENMGTLQPPRRPEGAEVVPPKATPEPIAPAAPPDSAQEKQFAESIEQRFAALQSGKDYFAILGVNKQVTKDQVKAAFLNLAKIFHPDRLPTTLQPLIPKINAVFESIREAYDTLHDDAKRQDYVQKHASSKKATAPPVTGTDAESAFKQAEQLFKKKEYAAAEAQYEAAFAIDRKAVYLAGKAWCLFMDPARRGDGSKAKQILNEAIRLDRTCDRALYELGVIARVEGDMERAQRHFRDAVQANPKHIEAGQELRLIEMRRKKRR